MEDERRRVRTDRTRRCFVLTISLDDGRWRPQREEKLLQRKEGTLPARLGPPPRPPPPLPRSAGEGSTRREKSCRSARDAGQGHASHEISALLIARAARSKLPLP